MDSRHHEATLPDTENAAAERQPSLFRRNRAFRLLWGADAASRSGDMIAYIALPLLAIVTLEASAFEVGVLTGAGYAAWLLVGLPAGALLDRRRKRPVMIGCDVARAVLLLSIPVAAVFGVLVLAQLYIVAFVAGILTTTFDIAHPAYVPHVVGTPDLVAGNATLQMNGSVAQIAGPSVGGALVQFLTAPAALLVTVVTFATSAICLYRINDREPAPDPSIGDRLTVLIRQGARYVWGRPVIRSIMLTSAGFNLFMAAHEALVILFLVHTVGVPPGGVGVLLTATGAGALAGALLANPVRRRIGTVRLMWLVPVVTVPFGVLMPFAESGWGLALFVVGAVVPAVGVVAFNIAVGSFVQTLVPRHLLARVGASIRVVTRSALPVGAVAAGTVALRVPIETILLATSIGMALSVLTVLASPIRGARDLADLA